MPHRGVRPLVETALLTELPPTLQAQMPVVLPHLATRRGHKHHPPCGPIFAPLFPSQEIGARQTMH